jgi:Flp pilus assembly protein TadD
MVLSFRQALVWRNTDALWEHALAVTENNHVAHNNLAVELQKRGDVAGALSHFTQATRIKPAYAHALNGQGQCLMATGRLGQAILSFQQAVWCDPNLALSHYNLGVALARAGEPEDAALEFREVLRLDPDDADARLNLGRVLLRLGRADESAAEFVAGMRLRGSETAALPELGTARQMGGAWPQAEECFRKLVALHPESAAYHRDRALCLSHTGRGQEAAAEYHESLRLDPSWPAAEQARAWRLATHAAPNVRWGPMAVLLAEKVVAANGEQARALDTLAAAYAEAGRFREAVQTVTRARRQVTAAGQADLAREIEGRLRLYETNRPYHSP